MKKCLFLLLSLATQAIAQTPKSAANSYPPPVAFTAEQDHANMMQQLGIKTLRPGPSGDPSAPTMPTMTRS
jgi:hypothetical protein